MISSSSLVIVSPSPTQHRVAVERFQAHNHDVHEGRAFPRPPASDFRHVTESHRSGFAPPHEISPPAAAAGNRNEKTAAPPQRTRNPTPRHSHLLASDFSALGRLAHLPRAKPDDGGRNATPSNGSHDIVPKQRNLSPRPTLSPRPVLHAADDAAPRVTDRRPRMLFSCRSVRCSFRRVHAKRSRPKRSRLLHALRVSEKCRRKTKASTAEQLLFCRSPVRDRSTPARAGSPGGRVGDFSEALR